MKSQPPKTFPGSTLQSLWASQNSDSGIPSEEILQIGEGFGRLSQIVMHKNPQEARRYFDELVAANPDLRLELQKGSIVIQPPAGEKIDYQSTEVSANRSPMALNSSGLLTAMTERFGSISVPLSKGLKV